MCVCVCVGGGGRRRVHARKDGGAEPETSSSCAACMNSTHVIGSTSASTRFPIVSFLDAAKRDRSIAMVHALSDVSEKKEFQ